MKKRMKMNRIKLLAVSIFAVALSGCGGGGSSSGGGQAAAGSYAAQVTGTVSWASGSFPLEGGLGLIIDADGSIRHFDGDKLVGQGSISGKRLNWITNLTSIPFFNQPSLRCTGQWKFSGTLDGLLIGGSHSSANAVCNGVIVNIGGTFKGQKRQ